MAKLRSSPVASDRFWDRRLVPSGKTKVLAVGRIMPKDWSIVRVTQLGHTDNSIILRFERLV